MPFRRSLSPIVISWPLTKTMGMKKRAELVDFEKLQSGYGGCFHPAAGGGAFDIDFELFAEFFNAFLHRPGRAAGQAADRRAGHDPHVLGDFQQQVEVLKPSFAVL